MRMVEMESTIRSGVSVLVENDTGVVQNGPDAVSIHPTLSLVPDLDRPWKNQGPSLIFQRSPQTKLGNTQTINGKPSSRGFQNAAADLDPTRTSRDIALAQGSA